MNKEMNEREGQELDQYFKDGLTTAAQNEVDEGWTEMKTMLQQRKKSSGYTRLYLVLGTMAAMLFLVLGYLVNRNNEPEKQQATIKSTEKPQQPAVVDRNIPLQTNAEELVKDEHASITQQRQIAENTRIANKRAAQTLIAPTGPSAIKTNTPDRSQQQAGLTDQIKTEEKTVITDAVNDIVNKKPTQEIVAAATDNNEIEQPVTEKTAKKNPVDKQINKKGFSLTFSVAPDMSGVNTVKNDKLGFGAGVLLSYPISNRITVSTGLIYAQKIYSTAYKNYKPAGSNHLYYQPDDVDANCSVLDIPINLSYTLLHKNNNTLSVGTGLSSYLMLKERYNYQYQNNYAKSKGVRFTEVKNENQHFLGVANLEVKYERTITPGLAIGVSPYLKLPLTKIGYGNVNLQSAGVAFSVKTDLGNFKKK